MCWNYFLTNDHCSPFHWYLSEYFEFINKVNFPRNKTSGASIWAQEGDNSDQNWVRYEFLFSFFLFLNLALQAITVAIGNKNGNEAGFFMLGTDPWALPRYPNLAYLINGSSFSPKPTLSGIHEPHPATSVLGLIRGPIRPNLIYKNK